MFEKEKAQVLETALALKEYRLIALSGGNVSYRVDRNNILVTPSGMDYTHMTPGDICIVDPQGNLVEGERRISVDTEALLYIFEHMPEIGAIIHTHQVYATAVGVTEDVLPSVVTTLPNAALGNVNVAPYSSAASLMMGIEVVNHLGGKRAVILKNHGVVTVGASLKEALYAAVYLEDAAKTYILAKSIGVPAILNDEQIQRAVEVFSDYGQK